MTQKTPPKLKYHSSAAPHVWRPKTPRTTKFWQNLAHLCYHLWLWSPQHTYLTMGYPHREGYPTLTSQQRLQGWRPTRTTQAIQGWRHRSFQVTPILPRGMGVGQLYSVFISSQLWFDSIYSPPIFNWQWHHPVVKIHSVSLWVKSTSLPANFSDYREFIQSLSSFWNYIWV